MIIFFFSPFSANYEVVEPNVLCLYYKFISEQIFFSPNFRNLFKILSLFFFSLKGISRSRETCNVKYKNHEMGEKGGKFPGNRSGNSHDNRAPP